MREVPRQLAFFEVADFPLTGTDSPREKKLSEPGGTVSFLTYHRGGTREKVLAGAAFWSFGTSKPGFRY